MFDRELRFVLAAGQPLARHGDPPAYRQGQFLGDAFPMDVWRQIEPLCRSALAGETRSREIWTAERSHCLMVDIGPLPAGGSDDGPEGARPAERRGGRGARHHRAPASGRCSQTLSR